MNRLLLLVFFISYTTYSQTVIKGTLLRKDKLSIPFATVQLVDSLNTITYTTSNENGFFSMIYKGTDIHNLSLKISHLSYKTKSVSLKNFNNETLNIILEEKSQNLQEIVIQSKSSVAKKKGDTLTYNLKAFTSGNEEKLVDVLKKLPGIEINQEGKILAQGKVVDNLLINGKKMFGENHKIATENIDAEMLESIDLLSNYETFDAIKEVEGNNNKTALNVNIKKEFLGKITGNTSLLGAYSEKYLLSSNLFKFNEKINITSILNFNNIGYQSLSIKDYFSMNKSVRQEMRNNNISSNTLRAEDIPSFLLTDDNVTDKYNNFLSFDIAYRPNEKFSVNGFSIFSHLQTKDNIVSYKTYFGVDNNLNFQEHSNSRNDVYSNQTKFNIDFKPSKTKLWNYTLLFDASFYKTDAFYSNMLDVNLNETNESKENNSFSIGHQLSFIKKIARNKLLSFNVFQEIKKVEDDLSLSANYHLFDSDNLFKQITQNKNNSFGFYSKLTYKKGKHIYRLSAGIIDEKSEFKINSVSFNNVNSNFIFLNFNVNKKNGKFNYKAGVEMREYLLNYTFNDRQFLVLPSLNLKYNFGQTHYLFLNYNKIVEFPNAKNLNENFYAKDFRTFINPSKIIYNTPIIQDVFSLNYFRFDLYNGIIIMLNSSYTLYDKRISNNTANSLNYINITPILSTENQFSWNNSMSYEHRIAKINNKFKLSVNYMDSQFKEQISDQPNTVKISAIGIKASLFSNFDKDYFNYEVGYNYNTQTSKFSLFQTENNICVLNPFISFNGKLSDKWYYYIDNSFEKYITEDYDTHFFNLSIKLKYKKNKVTYWVEAGNLLNLNNSKIIKTINKNNMLSTEIIDRLSGYIGEGLQFSF